MADLNALTSSAYSQALEVIASVEPRIAEATRQELADQRGSLKLIASENYASLAVLLTMGTWFSDKYAEGTVGHRFYAGCQNVDTVESLAAEHARELFGAEYAYAQPHSGIDANLVAFWSILAHRVEGPWLEKGGNKGVNDLTDADWEALRKELGNQRLLGMSLDAGGHLTHGFRPNISGKMFHQQHTALIRRPDCSTMTRSRQGARVQAAGARGWLLGLPPQDQLRQDARDRRRGGRGLDGGHGALRRTGGRQGLHRRREPGGARPRRHHDDAQDLTGPRGGMVLANQEFAPSVDRGCPMVLGGPLPHVMAAKAVALAEARQPELPAYAHNIVDNAQVVGRGVLGRGAKWSPVAPTTI